VQLLLHSTLLLSKTVHGWNHCIGECKAIKDLNPTRKPLAGGLQLQLLSAFKLAVLRQCSSERLESPGWSSSIHSKRAMHKL
jgi:hypothetical protein